MPVKGDAGAADSCARSGIAASNATMWMDFRVRRKRKKRRAMNRSMMFLIVYCSWLSLPGERFACAREVACRFAATMLVPCRDKLVGKRAIPGPRERETGGT